MVESATSEKAHGGPSGWCSAEALIDLSTNVRGQALQRALAKVLGGRTIWLEWTTGDLLSRRAGRSLNWVTDCTVIMTNSRDD
jgi:hypothetical protein